MAHDGDATRIVEGKRVSKDFREVHADSIGTGSLSTGELSPTAAEGVPQSITAALSKGFMAARDFSAGVKVADPRNYATDDAALQALVDWIEANGDGGSIHCGGSRPDGTPVTIENTVAMDPASRIPISWFFDSGQFAQGTALNNEITTTINDGSPMFDVCGNVSTGENIAGITFRGDTWDLGSNNVTLLRTRTIAAAKLLPGRVKGSTGDVIVLDSGTFDSWLNYYTPLPASSTTARCVVFANSEALSNPGADVQVGPQFKTEDTHSVTIENQGGHNRIRVGGKLEGAHGIASVVQETNSTMNLLPSCIVGRTWDGAHGIYQDGGVINANVSQICNTAGDGIRVGPNAAQTNINPTVRLDGITGDIWHFKGDTGGIIPYRPEAPRTLPPTPWNKLQYIDGWQLYRTGTYTLTAGGDAGSIYSGPELVSQYAGRPGTAVRMEWWVESDPAANTLIQEYRGTDTIENQQNLVLQETSGNASVTVGYSVFRRGQSVNIS